MSSGQLGRTCSVETAARNRTTPSIAKYVIDQVKGCRHQDQRRKTDGLPGDLGFRAVAESGVKGAGYPVRNRVRVPDHENNESGEALKDPPLRTAARTEVTARSGTKRARQRRGNAESTIPNRSFSTRLAGQGKASLVCLGRNQETRGVAK